MEKKEKKRHEFQQFKTEATQRTHEKKTCIQGSEPPSDPSMTCGEIETNTSSRNEELKPIEEEREHSGSGEPSMAESDYQSNSNKSESEGDAEEYSISTVSLGCRFRV